jgi:hypothetical protein
LRGPQAKRFFALLLQLKAEIEQDLGYGLDWQELPEGQDCRVAFSIDADPANEIGIVSTTGWQHGSTRCTGICAKSARAGTGMNGLAYRGEMGVLDGSAASARIGTITLNLIRLKRLLVSAKASETY